jgi:hypothetical protein
MRKCSLYVSGPRCAVAMKFNPEKNSASRAVSEGGLISRRYRTVRLLEHQGENLTSV